MQISNDLTTTNLIDQKLENIIPFEARDHDNLVEDFINKCGYTRREAIEACRQVEDDEKNN